jgi:hypothetical protein
MLQEQNQSAMDALSLLEENLGDVETTFPVLQAGSIDLVISDAKLEPTKAGNGVMLNLKFKTAMPWKTTLGVEKAPGFPVRHGLYIPHKTADNADAVTMAKQKLAQLKLSAFGTKEGGFGKPEQYIGRTVTASIGIRTDEQYGVQNDIKAFTTRNQ